MGKFAPFVLLFLIVWTGCKPTFRTPATVAVQESAAEEVIALDGDSESDSDSEELELPDANTMITSEDFTRAFTGAYIGSATYVNTNASRGGQQMDYAARYGEVYPTPTGGSGNLLKDMSSNSTRLVLDPEVPNCKFVLSFTTGTMMAHSISIFWGDSQANKYMGFTVSPSGAPQWNSLYPYGSPISSGSVGTLTLSTTYELHFEHNATQMRLADENDNELYSVTHDGTFTSNGTHDINGGTAVGFEVAGITLDFKVNYFELYGCD